MQCCNCGEPSQQIVTAENGEVSLWCFACLEQQDSEKAPTDDSPVECLVITRISARKQGRNPDSWAGFYWVGNIPHCVGDGFDTRKAAYSAVNEAIEKLGL